jgi:hypothetical protein
MIMTQKIVVVALRSLPWTRVSGKERGNENPGKHKNSTILHWTV